ncbi:hypothetical protein BHM03_00047540 [Ensete ventricosum]|uniref:Uncharacterized protein n=1 Tax=Ensete ventricosum TaxID=4639 RepID=A0A445MLA0_ENSVE|nr:hypothetical protein BHM03_00047540 [Ensete ventricosum]
MAYSSSRRNLLTRRTPTKMVASKKVNFVSRFGCSAEHNLPDSPFASPPAKSPFMPDSFFSAGEDTSASCITNNSSSSNNSHLIASTTSSLDVPSSFTSCFFPMPRYHPEKICRQTNEFTDFSLITFPPVCAGSPPAMEQLECKGGEEAAAEGEEDVPSSPST